MNKQTVLNSFLLAACLAVSAWVARKTAETAEHMAGVQAAVDAIKEGTAKAERASFEGISRLERKLDETVARREFDARLLALEGEQRKGDLHLRDVDLEIMKIKQGTK